MYCKYCGYENDDEASFCENCGASFDKLKSKKPMSITNKILIVAVIVLILGVGISAGTLLKTNSATSTTPYPTQSEEDLSDEAIKLVQNYKDPYNFTVATNVQGIINLIDSGSSRTHQADWSAKKVDNETYEVTMMIIPDEWDGSGGGTARWEVNLKTGKITPLDENAKLLMDVLSASSESSTENSGTSTGYKITYYMPASKNPKYVNPDLFKSEPKNVTNVKVADKNEPEPKVTVDENGNIHYEY